jgi:uncharacterized NAD(P)/FAD-binding protein YdhS
VTMGRENFFGIYDVIIVGAGYSGTLVAVHLARADASLRIALIERGKNAGRGVAYGTTDAKHLLNVRADQMGAFPDDVGHFYLWLQQHQSNLDAAGVTDLRPDAFIPRLVFGDYIQDLLREACERSRCLDLIRDEIVDITRETDGAFRLLSRDGKQLRGAQIVLAVGNFPPGTHLGNDKATERPWFSNNPYSAEARAELAEPGDILIIGTGLTSLDVLMSLAPIKREGKIHILSRRGLFPQPHGAAGVTYPPFFDFDHLPRTARELLRRVRRQVRIAAAEGIDWRPVIDSIRPFNQAIWQNLGFLEQKRFLRCLRSFWDIHRHRCAPQILAVKEQLEAANRLICHRGNILDFRPVENHVEVTYRPRGTQEKRTIVVRQVLSCTGPEPDYRKLDDSLVHHLLERDLLAPDPLRMGAYTDQEGRVLNQAGEPIHRLYTLGSSRMGSLYESIAVPELRGQARDVAKHILSGRLERGTRQRVARSLCGSDL